MERNKRIDIIRGLGAINIILIHTAWWSGQGYLPEWYANILLIIDVPIFFFLAGSVGLSKKNRIIDSIRRVYKVYITYIFYIVLVAILGLIYFDTNVDFNTILKWLVFKGDTSHVPVFMGSMWFMIYYIIITLVISPILGKVSSKKIMIIITSALFIICNIIPFSNSVVIDMNRGGYLLSIRGILFYTFFFSLGWLYFKYLTKDQEQRKFKYVLLIGLVSIVGLFLISTRLMNFNWIKFDIQGHKFNPDGVYMFWSLISIICTMLYMYRSRNIEYKKNIISGFFEFCGKNAIYFYFSQGLSSSFLYIIGNYIHISNIYIKFVIMALINVMIASIIVNIVLGLKKINRYLIK